LLVSCPQRSRADADLHDSFRQSRRPPGYPVVAKAVVVLGICLRKSDRRRDAPFPLGMRRSPKLGGVTAEGALDSAICQRGAAKAGQRVVKAVHARMHLGADEPRVFQRLQPLGD
jgi:hypothetical protein